MLIAVVISVGGMVRGQDSAKVKTFDYVRLKPIVHFFANAEYNPTKDVEKDYSFWIGRMMFGFQYQFDKHWSSRVLIDRTRLPGSMNTMYLKVANLRWTPNDRLAIEAGAVNQTNFIPFETFYGYRFVAETFQDRYYGITSSDLGIIAYYRISKQWSVDGAITNGEGPRIDQDNFGKLRFAGGVNFFPVEGLTARVFYQLKSTGEPRYTAKEQLINSYITYRTGDRVRVGVEFIHVRDYLNVPGLSTFGGTAFTCIRIYKSLSYLFRYDRVWLKDQAETAWIPTTIVASQNALITGFSIAPIKGITLCLNYQGVFAFAKPYDPRHRILFSFEYKI
jgi:hypothetical protein